MWNRNLTNHVSAFKGVQKAVAVKFGQVSNCIPKGTTFYNVMAKSSPFAAWKKIGTLTTMEDCVTSKYGDNHLAFQHQRIEEDWKLNDWWTTASGQITEKCGYAVTSLEPPAKCSDKTDFSEMC